jgi:TIR domain
MKVYISHASADTWIARKVCEDVHKLGIEVFLDNKDIQTGEDFDALTTENIANSNEMIVLVSHAALKSNWVMIEFGAARALGIRLIPILVDVTPNELPQPINRHLARDLNQIEQYYGELRRRSRNGVGPRAPVILPTARHSDVRPGNGEPLRVGDRVSITDHPREPDEFPVLSEDMRKYLGMNATITGPGRAPNGSSTFLLDVDDGTFYWAERWLCRASVSPNGSAAPSRV